jgi:hypothetical protein
MFSPLKPYKDQGSIAFINDKLGEIWYELKLISEDQDEIKLPPLRAELGKTTFQEVLLRNPSDQDTVIKYTISNPTNFDIRP